MNISFKRATLDDIEKITEIEKSAEHLKIYSPMLDPQELKEYLEGEIVYFIQKDNETIGSISYQVKDPEHAYISGLVILPEFQKQGLAREAMVKLLEELKDYKRIDLVTHPQNTPAIMLYLSLGFIIESWKDDYFGDGESRIVMAKIL